MRSPKIKIMVVEPKDVRRYITSDGKVPFAEWFDALRDTKAKSIIKSVLAITPNNSKIKV